MHQMLNRWQTALFNPISILPLVYMRVAFGGIMMWEMWRYFNFGWIKRYYIDPHMYFTYYGFEWLHPLPGNMMYSLFYALAFLAFCILVGVAYRVVTVLFFLGFTYVFLLDQANYLNHFYLISLISFMMIFLPANRALSVDALILRGIHTWRVPSWPLLWLRFQIGVAYVFGGVAKLNADWLQGEPMRMWLADRTDFPVIGRYFTQEWMVYGFTYGGLLLDLFVVPALMWRRTRWPAVAALISFHLLNDNLFTIGIFPWFMIATIPLFFPASWWPTSTDAQPQPGRTWQRPAIVGMLAVYAAVQVLFPMRHLLYAGDVNWTEEGHMFAWHMKLRSKSGEATFRVVDPATDQSWTVDPAFHLTSRQLGNLADHPQKVLMFSHYLGDVWEKSGYPDVKVYAQAYVSLNGRPYQAMIDPCVNLLTQQRSIFANTWVLPLQTNLKADTPTNIPIECEI